MEQPYDTLTMDLCWSVFATNGALFANYIWSRKQKTMTQFKSHNNVVR